MHHFISEDTERPPISSFIISSTLKNFRSKILWRSAEGFGSLSISYNFSHSEICETDITILIHEDILKFEISIDEVLGVKISQPKCNLHDIEFGLFFLEFL